MKWICALAFFSFGLTSSAFADTTATPGINQLAWLVGKTWVATIDPSSGFSHIDVHYEWAATNNFIQFTTKFVAPDGSSKRHYAGNFFYDPSTKALSMWYMDDANHITQGPVTVTGDKMSMTFDAYRVDVLRDGESLYHWTLFERSGDAWKQDLTLDYRLATP